MEHSQGRQDGHHGPGTKSLGLVSRPCCCLHGTHFSLVNALPPSAAFILKVFEFYFLVLVLFFLPYFFFFSIFVCCCFFFSNCPCLDSVWKGPVSLLPFFVHVGTGTHHCACFSDSALFTPQPPENSFPPSPPPAVSMWGYEG